MSETGTAPAFNGVIIRVRKYVSQFQEGAGLDFPVTPCFRIVGSSLVPVIEGYSRCYEWAGPRVALAGYT